MYQFLETMIGLDDSRSDSVGLRTTRTSAIPERLERSNPGLSTMTSNSCFTNPWGQQIDSGMSELIGYSKSYLTVRSTNPGLPIFPSLNVSEPPSLRTP